MANESTTIDVGEPSTKTKSSNHTKKKMTFMKVSAASGPKRGLAIFDLLLRLVTISLTIAAAVVMYTAEETLPFFTQFFQFQAVYDDVPTFQFFLIVVSVVTAYLMVSLLISIVTILRPLAVVPRLTLLLLDTLVLTLQTAASSAATAMVYLANEGNDDTNWLPICDQFGDFCDATSTAVIIAFMAVLLFVILIIMSAVALKGI